MNRLYLRKSTDKQEHLRQEYILKENGYTQENSVVYEESYSGKSTKNRPVLSKLLEEVEEGDKVIVTDLSRLARSVKDLWILVETFTDKKVILISLKENLDLSTSTGKLMFTIIGAMYQFERDSLSDRTREALAAKKASGVVLGRPKVIEDDVMNNAMKFYMSNKLSMKKVSMMYGISDAILCINLKKNNLRRER